MKYTVTTLEKIEKILQETGYVVRYERGNFQSGYCILEEKKVLVLNKFLTLEGRINTLIDILPLLSLEPESLAPESRRMLENLLKPQS
ncbi:MAG TPA: hypothetical protein VII28_09400 [Puia sp.]